MWTSQTLDLGSGRSLHLVQAGEGPDLLFIHGALTTHHDWREAPAVAELAKRHRVTIVDRPGHGLSTRPRFVGTPRDQAAQIWTGLDRIGIGRTPIVAHSFGCLVALAMAEAQPNRVSGLVLAAPLAFPEFRPAEHFLLAPRSAPLVGPLLASFGLAGPFDRAMLRLIQGVMFAPAPVPPHWRDTFPGDQVLDRRVLVVEGEDAASILPLSPAGTIDFSRIEAPVRILIGLGDLVVDRNRQARPLAAALRHAELVEVEGAGHMLHQSHGDVVEQAVRALELVAEPA